MALVVGAGVGFSVGNAVGFLVVGAPVGLPVGSDVGCPVVGRPVGLPVVGLSVTGFPVGDGVGRKVGSLVGLLVGAEVGSGGFVGCAVGRAVGKRVGCAVGRDVGEVVGCEVVGPSGMLWHSSYGRYERWLAQHSSAVSWKVIHASPWPPQGAGPSHFPTHFPISQSTNHLLITGAVLPPPPPPPPASAAWHICCGTASGAITGGAESHVSGQLTLLLANWQHPT